MTTETRPWNDEPKEHPFLDETSMDDDDESADGDGNALFYSKGDDDTDERAEKRDRFARSAEQREYRRRLSAGLLAATHELSNASQALALVDDASDVRGSELAQLDELEAAIARVRTVLAGAPTEAPTAPVKAKAKK